MLLSQAQKYDIPLNQFVSQEILLVKADADSMLHSGIKPYNQWYLSNQTFNKSFKDTGDYYYDFTVLLYQKHLLEIHENDVHIGMDLLFDVYLGNRYFNKTNYNHKVSTNSRGFRIVANIGKNVSFETRFYENQFYFPNYIDTIARGRKIAPGVGRVKAFKNIGWDVGNSMGAVSIKISKAINLKFGHDKMFIGHGYRSLFLSDNASTYPLLSFNTRSRNQKWQYISTYVWLQSLYRSKTVVSTEAMFQRKKGSFHYLSFKPSCRWEFGLFESTIFKTRFVSGTNEIPILFYNPIIGVNTLIGGLQSENNSMIGISGSYLNNIFQFYGQFCIDDKDKYGFQIGGKWFNSFGLKRNWLQIELNSVPSYMYTTSKQNILQSYTHMNQELAHPLGASFTEALIIYHFEHQNWFSNAQLNYTFRKRGDIKQFGENIFRANDDPEISTTNYQNIQTLYWKVEGGYQFNIKTRLQLFGQFTQRKLLNIQNSDNNQYDFYFVFGVRCNLNNYYLDL